MGFGVTWPGRRGGISEESQLVRWWLGCPGPSPLLETWVYFSGLHREASPATLPAVQQQTPRGAPASPGRLEVREARPGAVHASSESREALGRALGPGPGGRAARGREWSGFLGGDWVGGTVARRAPLAAWACRRARGAGGGQEEAAVETPGPGESGARPPPKVAPGSGEHGRSSPRALRA